MQRRLELFAHALLGFAKYCWTRLVIFYSLVTFAWLTPIITQEALTSDQIPELSRENRAMHLYKQLLNFIPSNVKFFQGNTLAER